MEKYRDGQMKEPLTKLDCICMCRAVETMPPLGEQLPDLSPRRELTVKN